MEHFNLALSTCASLSEVYHHLHFKRSHSHVVQVCTLFMLVTLASGRWTRPSFQARLDMRNVSLTSTMWDLRDLSATSCTCKLGGIIPQTLVCLPPHCAAALPACHLLCADPYLPGAPLLCVGEWTCNVVLAPPIHLCSNVLLDSWSSISVNHRRDCQCQ